MYKDEFEYYEDNEPEVSFERTFWQWKVKFSKTVSSFFLFILMIAMLNSVMGFTTGLAHLFRIGIPITIVVGVIFVVLLQFSSTWRKSFIFFIIASNFFLYLVAALKGGLLLTAIRFPVMIYTVIVQAGKRAALPSFIFGTAVLLYVYNDTEERTRFIHKTMQIVRDSCIMQGLWITGISYLNEQMLENVAKAMNNVNQKLRFTVTSKTKFLARCSHELRTPLTGIVGAIEILENAKSAEEQTDFLAIAKECSNVLMQLVNDLLDYSKLEVGQLQLSFAPVHLHDLIKKVIDPQRILTEKKGVKLASTIEENVPEMIHTDDLRLKQILTNIVGNAVKFTSRGSIDVTVSLKKGKNLKFVVQDTGPGIPPDKHLMIFEPFKQADQNITRQFGGTGLGLAIAKNLVVRLETFGGMIKVKSNGVYGSTFLFTIPYIPASPGIPISTAPSTKAKLQPMDLLVAEDNHLNQKVILRMLDKLGLHADIANNGREAVQKATDHNYSLILMDIEMPELDGYAATSLIRKMENHKKSPIIAFTAHVMNEKEKSHIIQYPISNGLFTKKKWIYECTNKTDHNGGIARSADRSRREDDTECG